MTAARLGAETTTPMGLIVVVVFCLNVIRIDQLTDELSQGLMLRAFIWFRKKRAEIGFRGFATGCVIRFMQHHNVPVPISTQRPSVPA